MEKFNSKRTQIAIISAGILLSILLFGRFGIIPVLAIFVVLGFFLEKLFLKWFVDGIIGWFAKSIPFPPYIVKFRDTGLEIAFISLMAATGLSLATDPIQFKPLQYEINPVLWMVSLYCTIAAVSPSLIYMVIFGIQDLFKSGNIVFDAKQIKHILSQRKKGGYLLKDISIFLLIIILLIATLVLSEKLSQKVNSFNLLEIVHVPEKVKQYFILLIFITIPLFLIYQLFQKYNQISFLDRMKKIGIIIFFLLIPAVLIFNIFIQSKVVLTIGAFSFFASGIILTIHSFLEKKKK